MRLFFEKTAIKFEGYFKEILRKLQVFEFQLDGINALPIVYGG